MEHELPGVLDGIDEPVTVEELEGVVRRAEQRRRATLVAGAAALLVLGALGGAIATGGDSDTTGFAAPRDEAQSQREPDEVSVAPMFDKSGGPPGEALTPRFRREANGITIRAYEVSWNTGGMTKPECAPPNMVQGQLSSAAAVTVATAPLLPGDSFAALGLGVFGQGEGEPGTWAIVRAGSGTSKVRLRAGNAVDTMDPQNGIAVLAIAGTGDGGVVEGLGPDGAVVGTHPVGQPPSFPEPDPACVPEPCKVVGADGPSAPAATTAPDPKVVPPPDLPVGESGIACDGKPPPPGMLPPVTMPGPRPETGPAELPAAPTAAPSTTVASQPASTTTAVTAP